MNLEYLVVGIAKENKEDFAEFYKKTRVGTYICALSILGDKNLARDAAVESYRRVWQKAYKFDTDMSAEYWLCDIVKNLCMNGLCDGEIAKKAETKLRDNLSLISTKAIFETDEDRGKIIAFKVATDLSMSQVANLLWYTKFSALGEYSRGIKQAIQMANLDLSKKEGEKDLKDNFILITPEYFERIEDAEFKTCFENISDANLLMTEQDRANPGETQDARKARVEANRIKHNKKLILIWSIITAVVAVGLAIGVTIYFVNKKQTKLVDPDDQQIVEPLYGATDSMIEVNGKLYYENRKDDSKLYVCDLTTKKSAKLSDADPKDFLLCDEKIYFRNANNGCLSYIDTETDDIYESKIKGSIPCLYKDKIVYSSKSGVSICDKNLTEDSVQLIYTAEATEYRYDIGVCDGNIIFSAGPTAGLFMLTEQEDGTFTCYTSMTTVIYDIDVIDEYFAFENGNGTLSFIRIGDTENKSLVSLKGELKSSAYCIDGRNVYYYGKKGIYKVSFDSLLTEQYTPALVIDLSENSNDVADLYVCGENVYCYYSNGEKEKPYNELVMYTLGENTPKGVTIFKVK